MALKNQTEEHRKYLELLAREFPTQEATVTEIINLQAIINLPKGTEHFMSDLHGEYEAFYHILNNSSGVIREKVDMLFSESMNDRDRKNLCTLIYYPKEKLDMLVEVGLMSETWAKTTLRRLLRLARLLSSKYTRSKVRKAMPEDPSTPVPKYVRPCRKISVMCWTNCSMPSLTKIRTGMCIMPKFWILSGRPAVSVPSFMR